MTDLDSMASTAQETFINPYKFLTLFKHSFYFFMAMLVGKLQVKIIKWRDKKILQEIWLIVARSMRVYTESIRFVDYVGRFFFLISYPLSIYLDLNKDHAKS